jgi:hypothetical protein
MEDLIIPTSEPSTRYEFDFDKIKTFEDVIRILKALRISFGEKYPAFEEVKDLLKEVNESEQ